MRLLGYRTVGNEMSVVSNCSMKGCRTVEYEVVGVSDCRE